MWRARTGVGWISYLVDTSRLMPPTFARDKTTSIFYELFRAEALTHLDVALSSDALSLFVSKKSADSVAMANEHVSATDVSFVCV